MATTYAAVLLAPAPAPADAPDDDPALFASCLLYLMPAPDGRPSPYRVPDALRDQLPLLEPLHGHPF